MNNFIAPLIAALSVGYFLVACDKTATPDNYVYTLYRNAPSDPAFRVHVATFDSKAYSSGNEMDEFFNKKNCERVQTMFQSQPDWADVKFWCEKGPYKK